MEFLNFQQFVNESTIGSFRDKIDIEYNIDKTKHAEERQDRHGIPISDFEISELVSRGVDYVANALMKNEINVGDRILLKDANSNLNVVGSMQSSGDRFKFIIITVMREDEFRNKKGTYTIVVK